MSNPLWNYACARYSAAEVGTTCVQLQDAFVMDVNLLLYAAWLASQDRLLSRQHLVFIDSGVAAWREDVIKPLRGLRRQLQGVPLAAAFRDEIKALELRAERAQLDTMYDLYGQAVGLPGSPGPFEDNLRLAARFMCAADERWVASIERLAGLLRREPGVASGQDG